MSINGEQPWWSEKDFDSCWYCTHRIDAGHNISGTPHYCSKNLSVLNGEDGDCSGYSPDEGRIEWYKTKSLDAQRAAKDAEIEQLQVRVAQLEEMVNSGTAMLAQYIHLSARPDEEAWGIVTIDAARFLNTDIKQSPSDWLAKHDAEKDAQIAQLKDTVRALNAENENLAAEQREKATQWQPIETAPKGPDDWVLVWCSTGFDIALWGGDGWWTENMERLRNVTHWMLPVVPQLDRE